MSSIFLSHNRKDKQFVRRLGTSLRQYGVKVWIDEAEIKIGDSLVAKIEQAINEMDYLGVVLSPDSVESEWVKREVEIAINDEINGKRLKVLPILARKCEIPGFVKGKLYADFRRKRDWESSLRLVVRTLGLEDIDAERVPGKRVIIIEDFIATIQAYFSPRKVEVRFYEDWGEIEYVKVLNNDRTFELYSYFTKPTYIDLINTVFGLPDCPPIIDIKLYEHYFASEEEIARKHDEIRVKFKLPENSSGYEWRQQANGKNEFQWAIDEYMAWLESTQGLAFVYKE